MFPLAIPPQAAGFHWLGTPCACLSLADCCRDEERQFLCGSPPRTTQGCLRLRLPLSPSVSRSALLLRALSLSRAAVLVSGPESTASAQVASFGKRSPAKPSHHRSLKGHLSGPPLRGGAFPSGPCEPCLRHFLRPAAPAASKCSGTFLTLPLLSGLKTRGFKCTGPRSITE